MLVQWKIKGSMVTTGIGVDPTAVVTLVKFVDGCEAGEYSQSKTGNGPINAACKAIEAITQVSLNVTFEIYAMTSGSNSEAKIVAKAQGNRIIPCEVRGGDIVMCAVEAYMQVLNVALEPEKVIAEVR